MFSQLIKTSRLVSRMNRPVTELTRHKFNPVAYQLLSRQFSGELTTNWPPSIKKFLDSENISSPTVIQEKTLPVVLKDKDLVGIARTGSGKTLAFVIPAVMKILKQREANPQSENNKDPTCLVLAPTRELASQINDVFKKFYPMGIRSALLVGGSSRSQQIRELSYQGHDAYVGTPGRLLDLLESQVINLSKIKYLVLDEADRMLDMGFEPQIRKILAQVPKERQTLMWSATWPEEVQELAQEFSNKFEYVAVDSEKLKANPNIKQIIDVCEARKKLPLLIRYLNKFKEECEEPRVLIFVNTKRMADQLLFQLMRFKVRAIAMHGDRTQNQRDNALRLFKNRSCDVMVATDVAARGLDISDITHIVNFDFPKTIEDYVHRIGRTARHDKRGVSVSFFTMDDAKLAKKLIRVLRETSQEISEELLQLQTNDRNRRSSFFMA